MRLLVIYFGIAGSLFAQANERISCDKILQLLLAERTISLRSPLKLPSKENREWQLIFVRDREHPGGRSHGPTSNEFLNPQYDLIKLITANGTALMRDLDLFIKTNQRQLTIPSETFKDLLRKEEAIILSDGYTGYYFGVTGIPKDYGASVPFCYERPDTYSQSLSIALPKENSRGDEAGSYFTEANGVELHAKNVIDSYRAVYVHFYPEVKEQPRLLEQLSKLFNSLLEGFVPKKHLTVDEYLNRLSDYYHLAINGHFFKRGNNSLFMAQVNYFLIRKGLTPISHGMLDHSACGHSYLEFRRIFKDAVITPN